MNLAKIIQLPLVWSLIIGFILFYPMLISIYVFLPLLIGVMGYLFMKGIEENKPWYIAVAVVYFINLEINLSLPLTLTIVAALLVYLLFFRHFRYMKKCSICRPLLSVVILDVLYLGMLLTYDFVFQTHSIMVDDILGYSLIIDLLVVVLF